MSINKDGTNRRNEIIDTASKMFEKNGILDTSMASIAKEVGVAKGLLYYYFETKDNLLQAVIQNKCKLHVTKLQRKWKKYPNFQDRFLILMDSYYGVYPYKKEKKYLNLNLELGISFHTEYLSLIHKELEELVAQGEAQHVLELEYPKEMIMMTLEGIFSILNIQTISLPKLCVLAEQSLNLKKHSLKDRIADLPLTYIKKKG